MAESEQLQLPYEQLTAVAGRTALRKLFKNSSRESYFIPFNKIKERPGFNQRRVYDDIPELAASIFEHGLKEPFLLDVMPDGNFAYIDEGHRRQRAIQLLIDQGKAALEDEWEFFPNKSKVTEMDRMVNQMTSNNNKKKLKPIEQAGVAHAVKHFYTEEPLTHEEVAKKLCVSRQQIDNLIKIASADDRLKDEMLMADMNITECLALIKHKKKGDLVTDKKEIQSHITDVTIPAQKDELAGDIAELNKLQKETPEEAEIREEKERTALLEIADEVKVSKLKQHLGKKLAAPVRQTKPEDFVDTENSGEIVTVDKTVLFLNSGTILTEDIIEDIQNKGVKTVFLFKPGCEPVAPSVVTVPPEKKEKEKFDTKIPGIKSCNKAIQSVDKIEAIVNKLDVPEDVKKDLAYWVHWAAQNMQDARQWIHENPPK